MDIWSLNSNCFKKKEVNFYLRIFSGEHKEAGSAGNCDIEKKEEDASTAKTLFWIIGNYKLSCLSF